MDSVGRLSPSLLSERVRWRMLSWPRKTDLKTGSKTWLSIDSYLLPHLAEGVFRHLYLRPTNVYCIYTIASWVFSICCAGFAFAVSDDVTTAVFINWGRSGNPPVGTPPPLHDILCDQIFLCMACFTTGDLKTINRNFLTEFDLE